MKRLKISLLLIAIFCIAIFFRDDIFATSLDDVDLGKYNIYARTGVQRYITYKGIPQNLPQYFYKDKQGVEHNAYCLNLYMKGAEDGNYDVNVEQFINDNVVSNIICNGYPYKTVAELGLADANEAIYATQFAIWSYINPLDLNSIQPFENPDYIRVVNAIKTIYNNGVNTSYLKDNSLKINSNFKTDIDNIDRNYYSCILNLEYNENMKEIIANISNAKITDLSNNEIKGNLVGYKEIKVLIPRENVLQDEIINCNFKTNAKETAILFGASTKQDYQNVGLCLNPFRTKDTTISINVQHLPSKLNIKKVDVDNNDITIENTKFKISWADTNELIGIFITDKNGNIDLTLEKEGKIEIEEIEVPNPYYIDKNNSKQIVEVTFGKTTEVMFKNEKIKGKIRILKTSSNYNKYLDKPIGSPISDTEFEIYDSNMNYIETVKTNENGVAETSTLLKDKYFIKESKNNIYYTLDNETIKDTEIVEHNDIKDVYFTNDSVDIKVEINKFGYKQTQKNDIIKYTFKNIKNLSNVVLDELIWTDYIPTNVNILNFYTGTYNQDTTYNIYYTTNKNDEKILLADNISTKKNQKIDLSTIELNENEKIITISCEFKNVNIGFEEASSPIMFCKVFDNISNTDIIYNKIDIIGKYKDLQDKDEDKWETVFYEKDLKVNSLPRTGK